jgi:hypothetical protein
MIILSHIAFRDLIQFTNPDDALRDRPAFGFADDKPDNNNEDVWVSSIRSGEHSVVPLLCKKTKPVALRFDSVDLPDGRGFLVVSTLDDESEIADNNNLAGFIQSLTQTTPNTDRRQRLNPTPSLEMVFLSELSDMSNDFMMVLSSRGKIINANQPFYTALSLTPR